MQAVNLSVSELQMYGTVKWLNASEALGKIKKSVEILTIVFIFKSAVVLLAHERIKTKKKSKVSAERRRNIASLTHLWPRPGIYSFPTFCENLPVTVLNYFANSTQTKCSENIRDITNKRSAKPWHVWQVYRSSGRNAETYAVRGCP